MSHHKRQPWKRRLLFVGAICLLMLGLTTALILKRLHFSFETSRTLAWIQGNHHPIDDFYGVRPTIVAHWGAALSGSSNDSVLDNTLTGLEDAVDSGADWIQIDVRCSADRQLVVFHDARVDTTTDGVGEVANLELTELKELSVLNDPQEKILTLSEVFDAIHARHSAWILAIREAGIQAEMLAWLDSQIADHQIKKEQILLCAAEGIIEEYRDCGYGLGYLACNVTGNNWMNFILQPGSITSKCKDLGCRFLAIPCRFASSSFLKRAEMMDVNVWLYGVESDHELVFFAKRRVSGFIVDDPRSAFHAFPYAESAVNANDTPGTESEMQTDSSEPQ